MRRQAGRSKPTYEELIETLIRKNIFSGPEWNTQKESDPELQYIPKKLDSAYKEWRQNGGWKYVREQANSKEKPSNDEIIKN